jgi:hypothetical protein
VALVTRGAPLAYINPVTGKPFPDPIALWYSTPSLPASYDSVTLYVGNVAGPVFATSLLAVAIGIAWLAYARRLSLVVAVGFLAGAVVALALSTGSTRASTAGDMVRRRPARPIGANLPASWAIRPVLGLGAGLWRSVSH